VGECWASESGSGVTLMVSWSVSATLNERPQSFAWERDLLAPPTAYLSFLMSF